MATGADVPGWLSAIAAWLTIVGSGIGALLGYIAKQVRRLHRRLDSIEELASDAYHEAGLARGMIEGRRASSGRRWYEWPEQRTGWRE